MIKVYVIKNPGRDIYYLQYRDPETGRRRTISAKTTKKRDAERMADQLEKRLASHGAAADGSIQWAAFVSKYLKVAMEGRSETTEARAATVLQSYARLMKPMFLRDVTASTVARYAIDLRTPADPEDVLQPATITTHLRTLKAALNWAARIGMIERCPVFPDPPRGKTSSAARGRPITAPELVKMMRAVRAVTAKGTWRSWRQFLLGLWYSGMRLGEAMELRWEAGPWPSVDTSGRRWMLRIVADHEKGKRDRLLPVVPDWGHHLARWPVESRTGFVWSPLGRDGVRCGFHHASRTVSDIGEAAGVIVDPSTGQTATAHDLRRAFGTRWAARLMPAQLQVIMRHRSIATTMTHYVQLDSERLADDLWGKFG